MPCKMKNKSFVKKLIKSQKINICRKNGGNRVP